MARTVAPTPESVAQTVADVMTTQLATIDSDKSVADAAALMASDDIGDVIVMGNGKVIGILTDRDIVVRVIAEGKDGRTKIADVVSDELITVTPDMSVRTAVATMIKYSVRRLPVMQGDSAVGIISLGDLAIELDPNSALGGISAAPGNA